MLLGLKKSFLLSVEEWDRVRQVEGVTENLVLHLWGVA